MIQYEAVAIIEFQGHVSSRGESAGHYICDIKHRLTESWLRTNDNRIPVPIEPDIVSNLANVILYRKMD